MSIEGILCVVVSCLFSAIAIVVAMSAKEKANNNCWLLRIADKRTHERITVIARENRDLHEQLRKLSKRVSDLEEQIDKEKESCQEPCRPRTCFGTDGEKVVMWVPERKCEDAIAENVVWKNQYRELSAKYDMAVAENKKLRETIDTIARVSGFHDKKKGE